MTKSTQTRGANAKPNTAAIREYLRQMRRRADAGDVQAMAWLIETYGKELAK